MARPLPRERKGAVKSMSYLSFSFSRNRATISRPVWARECLDCVVPSALRWAEGCRAFGAKGTGERKQRKIRSWPKLGDVRAGRVLDVALNLCAMPKSEC